MTKRVFMAAISLLLLILTACGGTPQNAATTPAPVMEPPAVPAETQVAEIPAVTAAGAEIPAMSGSSQLIATIEADGDSNLGLTVVQAAGAEKAVRFYDFDDAGACIRYVQIYSYNSAEDAALWYDNFLIGEGVTLEDATVVEVKEGADIAPEYETLEKVQAFCEIFQVPYEMK